MAGGKFRPRQSRRADRLQRHPGRRQDRDRHRAGRPTSAARFGWDTVEIDGNVDGGRSSRRCTARASATAGRRRSCCAPCRAAASRPSSGARRRISSASSRTNGRRSSTSWRRAMAERTPGRHARDGREGEVRHAARRSTRRSAMRSRRSRATRPDIVGLSADLAKYTDILPFRDAFPDRFFNVGMAEQNLIAVVGGPRQDRPHGLLHHLRGVRDAARLRFHRDRLRAFATRT